MFFNKFLFLACLLFTGISAAVAAAPRMMAFSDEGPVYGINDDIASIGPNPADLGFDIQAQATVTLVRVELLNSSGTVVRDAAPNSGSTSISTAGLPNGTYTLRITTNRAVHTTTIVVYHP